MNPLKDIDKLVNNKNFLLALLDVLFLVLPGLMIIFVFREDLISSLDWVKLTLLSASITAPLSFFNTMIFNTWEERLFPGEKTDFFRLLSMAIIISGIILDATLLLGHLFGKQFEYDFKIFSSIEGFLFLTAFFTDFFKKNGVGKQDGKPKKEKQKPAPQISATKNEE